MKTTSILLTGLGAICFAGAGVHRAAGESAAPKTHTLFMGVDLAVERDKQLRRVEDVTARELVIDMDGKSLTVAQSPQLAIRVNESLKIADRSVSVGKLVVERAYSPENDPFVKFVNAAGAASGQAAMENLAHMKLQQALNTLGAAQSVTGVGAGAAMAAATQEYDKAMGGYNQTLSDMSNPMFDVGSHAHRYQLDKAEENFDAIRVAFEVVAESSLARPFYVVIAQFREHDSKPNAARKWVLAKSLGAIEAGRSRRVDLLQGGFPPGFILENYSIHVYNEGEELATDVSRKRVEITADEAFQFEVIQYVGANKGASLPAKVATKKLTREMRQRIVPGQLSETYYVRVSKDGTVVEAFRDDAGKRPLQDPQLESVLKSVRFMPALEAGKPVERIAPLKLGPLSII